MKFGVERQGGGVRLSESEWICWDGCVSAAKLGSRVIPMLKGKNIDLYGAWIMRWVRDRFYYVRAWYCIGIRVSSYGSSGNWVGR